MHLKRRLSTLLLTAALSTAACATPKSTYEVTELQAEIRAGETQKLNKLLAALDSRDPEVREAAVRALAELAPLSIDPLKATVEKGGGRAGPALLALGLTGEPEYLDFIQPYKRSQKLGAYARQSERVIEDKMYQAAMGDGGIAAMEAYLEAFPEGAQREEVENLRLETLARASFARLKEAPTLEDMRKFLEVYPKTTHAEEVQRMLVTGLFAASRTALDEGRFTEARTNLKEVATLDPRRGADVNRLRAESYIKEGDALLARGETAQAMEVLTEATRFPEVRADAERRMAGVLLDEGRVLLNKGDFTGGIPKVDQAAKYNPALQPEIARLKTDHVRRLLAKVEAGEGDSAATLTTLMGFGEQAVRPVEEYLGTLFAQREYGQVEAVMAVLGTVLAPYRYKENTTGDAAPPIAVTRLRDSLGGFIRSGFTTAITEVSRLFSAQDFRAGWEPSMSPLDPRRAPLVLRVEQITANYLGLLRMGLAFKALLGENGMEVITGDPVPDDRLKMMVRQGDIGANPSALLLTRVQLAGTYAKTMGDLIRIGREDPVRVLVYAVNLAVPPYNPEDWMTLAEGVSKLPEGASNLATISQNPRTVTLVGVEADPRQVSLSIFNPVVAGRASGEDDTHARIEAATVASVMNLSRLVYGLYPGIDRVTVMLGTYNGRFEPLTRYTINQKGFAKLDGIALRQLAGTYGPEQAAVLDVTWTRWSDGE